MKATLDRTKVVLRHLPPAISEATLVEQVDGVFAGRYNWVSFRPGKTSQNHQSYSRAYIDFKRPEDVLEFADVFNGHVFVNEKGTQFKSIVEYAPSQRVPKQGSKKDGREGTISKDPEYLEFLEFLAKPVENLPSAEIQLERKEAERAGLVKDASIVTPLMDFVRQKRAAKVVSRRSSSNGKLSRKASGSSSGSPSSASSRRGSEKRRGSTSTTMYVKRNSSKNASSKDKSTYILVPKRDEQKLSDKPVTLASSTGTGVLEEESGVSGIADGGKRKVLLIKGKEREIFNMSGSMSHQQSLTTSVKNVIDSTSTKQNSRREGSGRVIRGILLKDGRQSQTAGVYSEQPVQSSNSEKDKRPPRPPQAQVVLKDTNGALEDKAVGNDLHGLYNEKHERRAKIKDKPDRGVWNFRRSDGSYASDESLSSSASQSLQITFDSSEACSGTQSDMKVDMSNARGGQMKTAGSGRNSSLDNGFHKHVGRRGPVADSFPLSDGKSLKRGGTSHHEVVTIISKSGCRSQVPVLNEFKL
ncbi:hypothetical protein SLEP1_g40762 [Rubroshorea leprosula]|uniref:UPF3 domain-containing protein n=1 Tax=Rubroshorea leprosula TaxID=152421 RepID=A0AAV5L4V7_9ROSI|nr:hypothetical protein SLEP1_g40762 [Rubroshorea leprosula]